MYRQQAHFPSLPVIFLSNGRKSRTMKMYSEGGCPLLLSQKNRERNHVIASCQRSRRHCLSPSLNYSCRCWHELRVSKVLGTTGAKEHKTELFKVNRIRAYYKSEDYDIIEAKLEALTPLEAATDVLMVEASAKEASPWWEQFPKRWVLVLLCFMAFLLCNMDRVWPLQIWLF